MVTVTLAVSLLRNMLAGKPKIPWRREIREGEGVIPAGEGSIATSF